MSFACHLYSIRMPIVCTRMSHVYHTYVTVMYSYVIRMSLVCPRILTIYTRMSFLCHSHVLACHPYVTHMHFYVIVCNSQVVVCHPCVIRISFICHLYVLLCFPLEKFVSSNDVNKWLFSINSAPSHAHSKQLFTGHLNDACAKTSDIVVIKIMTSAPGVEIRIAFLICYLQSLYEIELGHYFCPEFVGHVTNQNILVDAGKLM